MDQKERELRTQQAKLTEAKNALKTIDESLSQLRRLESDLNGTYVIKVIDAVSELLEKLEYSLLTEDVERLRLLLSEAQKAGFPQQINSMAAMMVTAGCI